MSFLFPPFLIYVSQIFFVIYIPHPQFVSETHCQLICYDLMIYTSDYHVSRKKPKIFSFSLFSHCKLNLQNRSSLSSQLLAAGRFVFDIGWRWQENIVETLNCKCDPFFHNFWLIIGFDLVIECCTLMILFLLLEVFGT